MVNADVAVSQLLDFVLQSCAQDVTVCEDEFCVNNIILYDLVPHNRRFLAGVCHGDTYCGATETIGSSNGKKPIARGCRCIFRLLIHENMLTLLFHVGKPQLSAVSL